MFVADLALAHLAFAYLSLANAALANLALASLALPHLALAHFFGEMLFQDVWVWGTCSGRLGEPQANPGSGNHHFDPARRQEQ